MSELRASVPADPAPVTPAAGTADSAATAVGEHPAHPRHVAIIMDGNYRWAKARHLPGAAGHRAGARNVRPVAEACADAGVECLTLFAFSTENWRRPKREVNLLMDLMRSVLENDVQELNERGVQLRIIGDRARFAPDLRARMDDAETLTRDNDRMRLNIAANYGGRWDITQAARSLARAVQEGRLKPEDIDESSFARGLSLGEMPEPDLCIRTGGDHRISNFLLWEFAYTELFFTDAFWPAFGPEQLIESLAWFNDRQRRFGRRS
ncbi:MAG: polyprenyl diphosphate synthase [Pseudomonadales bacterium]